MKCFHLALALFLGLALAQTHDPLDPAQFSALPEGYSVRLLAGAEEVREAALLQGGRAFPMARQLAFSGKEVWRGLLPELGPYEIRLKTKAGEERLGPYPPPAHPFRALAWVGVRGGYQVFPDRFGAASLPEGAGGGPPLPEPFFRTGLRGAGGGQAPGLPLPQESFQIGPPGLGDLLEVREEEGKAGGPGGLEEAHARLLGGAVPLLEVAGPAGGHQVLPGAPAPPAFGEDVVHGELAPLAAAVLAGVAVPPEDVAAVQGNAGRPPPDQALQPDDAGDGDSGGGGVEEAPAFRKHLRAPREDQKNASLDAGQAQDLVGGVQDQHPGGVQV